MNRINEQSQVGLVSLCRDEAFTQGPGDGRVEETLQRIRAFQRTIAVVASVANHAAKS